MAKKTYKIVTTYSGRQFSLYAKDMVESVYQAIPPKGLDGARVAFEVISQERLEQDPEFIEFLSRYKGEPWAHGIVNYDPESKEHKVEYRYQAIKFAHKVFAYTNPNLLGGLGDDDWLIWLDADTVFTGEITLPWLQEVCPEAFMGSYIGRKDWDHSECGWIAWSMRYHGKEFLEHIRHLYTSGLIFGLPQWHDSYVFDVVRQAMQLKHGSRWLNLAKDLPGTHPWPDTKLGEIIEHYKGLKAKQEKYGDVA